MSEEASLPRAADVSFPRTFEVRRYVAEGGFSLGGMFQLVGALGVVGIILGVVTHFVSQWFYLILLFPILIGAVVGAVGKWCITKFKIRRPITCGLAGFAAGCLAMFSIHYADYQQFESQRAESMGEGLAEYQELARNVEHVLAHPEELPEDSREDIIAEAQEIRDTPDLKRFILVDSIWDYIDYSALQEVELKRAGRGGKGANLGYIGSYTYWGIEALIVAVIAFGMMSSQAGQPFCGECSEWKLPNVFLVNHPEMIRQALEQGKVEDFAATEQSVGETAQVSVFYCPECGSDGEVDVRVERVTVNSKNETQLTQLTQMTFPGEAHETLTAAFGGTTS